MTVKIRNTQSVVPTTANGGGGATATANPWLKVAEAENDYDPLKFYVKATDWRGHGERISTKVPPELYAQCQQMVHDESLPDYDSPQDMVRDGLVHLMAMRTAQLGGAALKASLHAFMRMLALAEWAAAMKRDSEAWSTLDEDINATMTTLQRDEAFDQMRITLDRYEEFADGIPEPYQSKSAASIRTWRQKVPAPVIVEE